MHSTTLFSFLFACASALAGPAQMSMNSLNNCDAQSWDNATHHDMQDMSFSHLQSRNNGGLWRPPKLPAQDPGSRIKVHWNVLMRDSTLDGGNIPDSMIAEQMQILNKDFAPIGLSFELVETKRTTNARWFNTNSKDRQAELEYKASFGHIDDASVLKIWSIHRESIA
ncbi:hypothetical protein HGRIS_013928 [Hohenbuehelia grisea]|uniref:Uncharacterized protein n=1 Tax=Hohenbuehelia grisea TaxID=104357 RepID=A0ABR3JS33_9AGAR